ncbi:MAG TPA: DNA gyrase/topoisomerase IV subunit A, partial [Agriterribacter sp.]|nr:DNA gyrase/topoisomerase IV subunit A [Agriterribacter sp.]
LEIKGRGSMGNQVTKYPVKSIRFKEAGRSTLSGRKLWFDDTFGRLNAEEKGQYLGMFDSEDRILIIYNNGNYEISDTELSQHIDSDKVLLIEKFDPEKVITAVYLDKEKLQYNIKRFKIETTTLRNMFFFIKEGEGNRLQAVTTDEAPVLIMQSGRGAQIRKAKIRVNKVVEVMGWKAVGAKLADYSKSVEMDWEKKKAEDNQQPELF